MVVGVCRVVLALPGVDSLKGKRAIVRRIVERTKHRFGAAAAEVDTMDSHRRAVLGFAVVSNDGRHAQSVLDRIVSYVAGATEAVLVDRTTELVHMGASMGMLEGLLDPGQDTGSTDDVGSNDDEGAEDGDERREP